MISTSLVTPADAANNQGLDWTIELGVYNYTLTAISSSLTSTPPGEYDVYVNLTSLPLLYDDMNSPDYFKPIYSTHYMMYFQNGTLYPDGYENFMIMATGNWSALEEIWQPFVAPNTTWIDTHNE